MRKTFAAALALILMLCAAASAQVSSLNGDCEFHVNSGDVSAVTDASFRTAWAPDGGNGELRITLPDNGAAQILIGWKYPPENYTLTQYDAEMNVIATHGNADDEFACITALLPLEPEADYLSLDFSQPDQAIQAVRVYPDGALPAQAVKWEKPLDKCDLMVISTHQDDEWLWFGAIIPYYDLVKNKDVQVVYMADCGRYRYQEALNSLAVAGVRTYPHFVGLKDRYDGSLDEAVTTWRSKDHILDVVVEVIRRYKPEVILTHDWNGEYGHPQHILTSRCMEYAIEAAADPARYPDSAQRYGAWQVKKLYRHLEKKNPIEFDWHVSYPEFGGRTGIQVATDSMNEHASQLKSYHVEDHGRYDNALFGLSYSTVGDDVLHEDLFENIPEATPATEPTPESTAGPLPTGTEASPVFMLNAADDTLSPQAGAATAHTDETDIPGDALMPAAAGIAAETVETATPVPETGAARTASSERGHSAQPFMALGVAGVAAAGGGAVLLYNRSQKRRRRSAAKRKSAAGQARRDGGANASTRTRQGTNTAGASAHSRQVTKVTGASANARQGARYAGASAHSQQGTSTNAQGTKSPAMAASRQEPRATAHSGGSAVAADTSARHSVGAKRGGAASAAARTSEQSATAGQASTQADSAPRTRREARHARQAAAQRDAGKDAPG